MPHERRYHECEVCLRPLVTQRAWMAAGPGERAEMLADGYAPQGVGPRCTDHRDRPPYEPDRCSSRDCDRPVSARGLCSAHDKHPRPGPSLERSVCIAEGCRRRNHARGLCSKHYQAARRAAR